MSTVMPRFSSSSFTVWSRMVRAVSPRKSILSSPSLATGSMLYWVIITGLSSSPFGGRCSGTMSRRGSSAISTPAGWVLTW